MGILNDEFNRLVKSLQTDESLLTEVCRIIIRSRGLTETDKHIHMLVQSIIRDNEDFMFFCEESNQAITVTQHELDNALNELLLSHEVAIESTINTIVTQSTPEILQSLHQALPQALREWHKAQSEFEKSLYKRWKDGLDRIDMLISIAHEAAETYIEDLSIESTKEETAPDIALINVLTALHCRACRTAREIACLLKSGYADGAHARWRSLHEIAVTATFIAENQGNTAQRYLDHAVVERFRSAKSYQLHCKTLGYESLSDYEFAELEKAIKIVTDKYGASFCNEYGWAAEALQLKRPTFKQIENSLDMAHWRPWFGLACQNVHAGSQGLHFAIGLPNDDIEIILAGASNYGLADPGHQMSISLTMATIAFLTIHPNIDALVTCHCMLEVCDEIGEEMLRVHETLEEEQGKSD